MDMAKVLQNTSNLAHLHCDVCQGFGACSACLWESSRKINLVVWISTSLYFLDLLWLWNLLEILSHKIVQYTDYQPVSPISTAHMT